MTSMFKIYSLKKRDFNKHKDKYFTCLGKLRRSFLDLWPLPFTWSGFYKKRKKKKRRPINIQQNYYLQFIKEEHKINVLNFLLFGLRY